MEITDYQTPAQLLAALLAGFLTRSGFDRLRELLVGDLEKRVKALEDKSLQPHV